MRFLMITAAAAALSACSSPPPDSGRGVGFDSYDAYQSDTGAREAELTGRALPAPDAVSTEPLNPGRTVMMDDGSDLAAQTQAALGGGPGPASPSAGDADADAVPAGPAPAAVTDASGISQENDFDAVGAQRSIESDAARIAQNRAQYQVVAAEALPTRPGDSGPNIVDYALATQHPLGTQVYRRMGIGLDGKAQRSCAKYTSPDKAQSDFLAKGGPQRDRLGLDPDGDGYACAWDPRPFRKAVGG